MRKERVGSEMRLVFNNNELQCAKVFFFTEYTDFPNTANTFLVALVRLLFNFALMSSISGGIINRDIDTTQVARNRKKIILA